MPDETANPRRVAHPAAHTALALLVAGALIACSAATAPSKTGMVERPHSPQDPMTDLCALSGDDSGGDPDGDGDGDGDSDSDSDAALTADEARDKITQLVDQIATSRKKLDLPVEPRQAMAERMASKSVAQARKICERKDESSLKCTNMCKLSTSICDNAARICTLAKKLGNDNWAKERCTAATTSCAESADRCCQCSL